MGGTKSSFLWYRPIDYRHEIVVKLVAHTVALDTDVDLLALCRADDLAFCSQNVGVVGFGLADRIVVRRSSDDSAAHQIHAALSSYEDIDEVDLPGTGAVAFGAFPFVAQLDCELLLPRIIIGRHSDGTTWVTRCGPEDQLATQKEIDRLLARQEDAKAGFARDAALQGSDRSPSSFSITPLRAPEDWCDAVDQVAARIANGEARKVVLARGIDVKTDRPVDPSALLSQLRRTFPASYLFSFDGFVGATPEMLVQREGEIVRAHPMAGTAPRSGDAETDARLAAALLASTNTRDEHRHTIDMVHETLLPWCSYLDEEDEPSIVAVANVQHLSTRLEGRLSAPPASVIELVDALHPTPAVGGSPRGQALQIINEVEQLDRGRYAGPVGWVDNRGNGTWAVGIRSAQINGDTTRIYAGVGVVIDSIGEIELAETRAKLQAMLGALVRP